LNSDFRQIDFHGQLLATVDVRVVGLLKGPFQLVQLERRERRPVATVFLAVAAAAASSPTAATSSAGSFAAVHPSALDGRLIFIAAQLAGPLMAQQRLLMLDVRLMWLIEVMVVVVVMGLGHFTEEFGLVSSPRPVFF
jgi:hypothetical protein